MDITENPPNKQEVIYQDVPEEFKKIISEFITDIISTFPEYELIINKWWLYKSSSQISEEEYVINKMKYIFNYCLSIFPERFFEILYQNNEIFNMSSLNNTEFLPGISFKYIMNSDISTNTKDTIWKYLKLIMISLASSTKNNTFLETAKLFESLDQETFKEKLQETMENISQLFDNSQSSPSQSQQNVQSDKQEEDKHEEDDKKPPFPNNPFNDNNISSMLDGKLGELAREIAEETASSMNIDMNDTSNPQDIFKGLFQNPAKLMDLVKSVGSKLENKIKSGDIKENELFSEATEIMKNMKNMPGMDNIQDMLKNMGINPNDLKKQMNPNYNSTQNKPNNTNSFTKLKEKAKNESKQSQLTSQILQTQSQKQSNPLTDEQLISMFTPTNVKKDTKKQKKK